MEDGPASMDTRAPCLGAVPLTRAGPGPTGSAQALARLRTAGGSEERVGWKWGSPACCPLGWEPQRHILQEKRPCGPAASAPTLPAQPLRHRSLDKGRKDFNWPFL